MPLCKFFVFLMFNFCSRRLQWGEPDLTEVMNQTCEIKCRQLFKCGHRDGFLNQGHFEASTWLYRNSGSSSYAVCCLNVCPVPNFVPSSARAQHESLRQSLQRMLPACYLVEALRVGNDVRLLSVSVGKIASQFECSRGHFLM